MLEPFARDGGGLWSALVSQAAQTSAAWRPYCAASSQRVTLRATYVSHNPATVNPSTLSFRLTPYVICYEIQAPS